MLARVAATFGSLFAGIGGADLGLSALGLAPVWQVERDPYRSAVLAKRFPGVPNVPDARDVSEVARLPRADILYTEPQRAQAEYAEMLVAWLVAARPLAAVVNVATGGDASVYDTIYRALLRADYVATASNVRYVTAALSIDGRAVASACRTMLVVVAARAPLSVLRLPDVAELRLAAGAHRAPSVASGYLETAVIDAFADEEQIDVPGARSDPRFPVRLDLRVSRRPERVPRAGPTPRAPRSDATVARRVGREPPGPAAITSGVVTITVRGPWATVAGPTDAVQSVRELLTVERPGARFSAAYKSGRWDGTVCLLRRPANVFPSGLAERVVAHLEAGGAEVRVALPPLPDRPPRGPTLLGVELRPYQSAAAATALRRRRTVLECPTGGGKTEIGAEVLRLRAGTALWLTHRADLAGQTRERLKSRLGGAVGLWGAGKRDAAGAGGVTVGMVQTVARAVKSRDAAALAYLASVETLVFDEAHHGGADTWALVAEACAAAEVRVGLSGTARTGDPLRDLRAEGACGPRVVVAEFAELAAQSFVATPTVRLVEPPRDSYPTYEAVREAVLPSWRRDPRPLARLGTRLFERAYRAGVVENAARTDAIAAATARHYRAGERVLVMCDLREHAAALDAALGRAGCERRWVLTGESPDRAGVLARFRAFDPPCLLIATPWFREGMDLPQVDVGVLAGATMSEVAVLQSVGRMLRVRPDKREVLVYDCLDGRDPAARKDYLAAHTLERLRVYRERDWAVVRQAEWLRP